MNSCLNGIILVFKKELLTASRFKGAWLTALMFSITTISVISLTLKGEPLESQTLSALFWTTIFFSSTTGVDRLFMEEEFSGTIRLLRIYGEAQAILFGKMLYGFLLLLMLSFFSTILFFILLDVNILPVYILPFIFTLILGAAGLSVSGVFLAAISATAKVKSGLFPILTLPLTLPLILPLADITAIIFENSIVEITEFIPIILYVLILTVISSILFDYIWYEDL